MDNTDYQISLSILSIVGAGIGIILLLNSKYNFFNNKEASNINLYNRVLLFLVFSGFLLINYNDYIKAKEKGYDITSYKLQLLSSILIVVATFLSLVVAYKYNNAALENPDI